MERKRKMARARSMQRSEDEMHENDVMASVVEERG